MKLIKKDKKGFTLVELIVVIAILAILALILIPAITGYVSKAENSRDEANARSIYSAAMFEKAVDPKLITDGDLQTAVAKSTGIPEGDFTVKIGDDKVSITVTYKNVSFDGKIFGEKTETP